MCCCARQVDMNVPPHCNALLTSLPEDEWRTLARSLDLVRLHRGQALDDALAQSGYVYFPTSGLVSVHYADTAGSTLEMALVGQEGMIGVLELLGGRPAPFASVVQAPGQAYRLPAARAQGAFARQGAFHAMALRYALSLIVQLAQRTVCNLRHSVDQQLCRWLLLYIDRAHTDEILATHEMIAATLGVRRQGVTEAAKKLNRRHIIAYARGRIKILDRDALERSACECYRMTGRDGQPR